MGPVFDRDLYMLAWKYAATHHLGQPFPGTELPYIVHIGAVAMEVIATLAVEPFDRPNLAVACALLHDVIEDTATKPRPIIHADLVATFGAFDGSIADGVAALSKDPAITDKSAAIEDSLARILGLRLLEVALVKLADRVVNMEPPPRHWSAEKRTRYHGEARHILERLGHASATLSARLQEKIARYERHLDPVNDAPPTP